MSYRSFQNRSRDSRSSRSALFDDGVEEGGLIASYSSCCLEIKEHDNDRAIDTLHDRVNFLKREAENHNRLLDRMGNGMDISRGVISGTMDRFKAVMEKKSNRRTCVLAGYLVLSFLGVYYLTRILRFFL